MGGLAHNLKTPIMSISGCISAAEALVEECEESLDDPEVVAEDYREIYAEIRDWFQKVRESSAYMSDIITAIKGQAASVSADQESSFTVDELIKRTTLLMRHELFSGGCKLVSQYDPRQEITLHGDINNLIQVLNNPVSYTHLDVYKRQDFTVGTPVSGRLRPELQGICGPFINTLPLRLMPGGELSGKAYLQAVKDTVCLLYTSRCV